MDLMYRELAESDFKSCLALLQGQEHYSKEARAALSEIWRRWLVGGTMSASVMESRKGSAAPKVV